MDAVAGNMHDANNEAGVLSPEDTAKAAGVENLDQIPEKFRNEDGSLNQSALFESYLNLESKLGEGSDDKKADNAQDSDTTNDTTDDKQDVGDKGGDYETNPEAAKFLSERGIDMADVNKAFYDNNESLPEEWYAKFEEAGIPRSLVDTHVAGVKSANSETRNSATAESDAIMNMVGGDAGYNQMMDWVDANGSAHAEKYNAAVKADDMASLKIAVADMYAEYRAADGTEPAKRVGQGDTNTAPAGFRSMAEMVRAMKDSRYDSDPAYRADVAKKALASTF